MKLKTYTDGGARGNPGPAAIGVLVCDDRDEILLEHAEAIGETTNNVAEYRALIEGLKRAKELGAREVDCFMDSELVVKQLRGEYKLKHYNMQKLFDEVKKAAVTFERISYTHLPREQEQMRRADQLVNYALDEEKKKVKRWSS
ncbi:MAG: reverse transcriptase-like protein [Candidatus Omnitrophica bacterium]|nr:reverse transcriptase-like protein [Candidatus Omnitrophota bacterium]